MSRSVKEQIKAGLKLGGGLAAFLVALVPMVDGLRRVVWAVPAQHVLGSDLVGWLELLVAAAILFSTAHIWVQWFAGCLLFAVIKCIAVFVAGKPISRPLAVGLVVAFLVTLTLSVAIVLRGTTLLDRAALTLFVFSLAWRADAGLFMPTPYLGVGVVALLVSWSYARYWRKKGGATAKSRTGSEGLWSG